MFSDVLKYHQTAVTVFALFATKNRASLFRKFRNLVVLAINAGKFQGWPGRTPRRSSRRGHQSVEYRLHIRARAGEAPV